MFYFYKFKLHTIVQCISWLSAPGFFHFSMQFLRFCFNKFLNEFGTHFLTKFAQICANQFENVSQTDTYELVRGSHTNKRIM
jgi:hypothetical protein